MGNSTLKKEQVRENIIYRIISGEYSLDGRIPPERELCNIMNVSRITVRAAVDALVNEGILERDGRRGTLIKKIPQRGADSDKKQKHILFVYFSSVKGCRIDHFGASARLYHGVEYFANKNGCGLMVQSGENFLSQHATAHNFINGIVVGGSQLEKHIPQLLGNGIPVVAVETIPHGFDIDAVCEDNASGHLKLPETGQVIF
jgi:DNA-binding transcriptional regulator YhcF (GntR family)